MSGQGYEELKILNRKLDELLKRYNDLKEENGSLLERNKLLNGFLQQKEEQLKEIEIKYERTRLSGALLGDGANSMEARKKITDLVREIDRCVALLNR